MGIKIPTKKQTKLAVFYALIFLFVFYFIQVFLIFKNAIEFGSRIDNLKENIISRDFEKAKDTLEKMNSDLGRIDLSARLLYPFNSIPGISQEFKSARLIISAGKNYINSGIILTGWASEIPELSEADFSSVSSLSADKKGAILARIDESSEIWEKINNNSDSSMELLERAKDSTKLPVVSGIINEVISKINKYQNLFDAAQTFLSIAPDILGYPTEKAYLLLLQNNTELRPTGGFIGTYGILKIKNAEVVEFLTDNVYNLDEPAKAYNTKVPPLPMQKYIKQKQWFFRDSNWDPDFPTTAQRAIQFYKDEKGPVSHFNGVIAFTPDLIEDIMSVIGPIYADGKEFTSENLVELLAWHVEKGFTKEGVTAYNRKKIIDDIAQQIKEKIFSLSSDKIKTMLPIIMNNFEEHQLMVWFENPDAQKIIQDLNWGNRILPAEYDYLYVVDANLGSLKSDPAINRTINYKLSVTDQGELRSNVEIIYEHTGKFDWKTTRYRTYARVYVPYGSKLISAKGNEEDIKITDEHGKTVFGTFISIEPGKSETLSFTYSLPKDVVNKILLSNYELLVQKQAGTSAHKLNLDITLPFSIDEALPKEIIKKKSDNSAKGSTDLKVDRKINVTQKE